jgi:predicted nucleotidyltransferase component of viral defense system
MKTEYAEGFEETSMDSIAAKQFLISRVVEQAKFEFAPLSEIERKMLYFTEVHPTLPDIYKVNEEFERKYDADEYEAKIVDLLKNARTRDSQDSPTLNQQWKDALNALKKEDHYILVMTDLAFGTP